MDIRRSKKKLIELLTKVRIDELGKFTKAKSRSHQTPTEGKSLRPQH